MFELSRTDKTEENYLYKATGILNRTAQFYDVESSAVTANMMAQYVIEKRVEYSKSTFRQYKAALAFYLETYQHLYPDYQEAIEYLYNVDQSDCLKKTYNTSQLRRKNFTVKQLNYLIFAISLSDSPFSRVTALWLQAGALTGLRPHEWQNAKITTTSSGQKYLVVKNAKNTNGRTHGEYRHIEITEFSAQEMKILQDFFEIIHFYQNDNPNGFDQLQQSCIHFLKYTNRKLLNGNYDKENLIGKKGSGLYQYRYDIKKMPRITLYSARHFFSSQAKKSMLSLEEIAALMGHKTNKTASTHYGKSKYSQGGLKVKPLTAEVNKIEQKYSDTKKSNVQSTQQKTVTPQKLTMRK